ncbi:ABC transporter substrate-binding protein [Microlunatus ginsengisoli]|uniref:ABC transporter substrate-binding protein n=1 Tax=Microlunatus ginsengisoli TaxID=363863 RepID=A0ABP7AN05_9ACTN
MKNPVRRLVAVGAALVVASAALVGCGGSGGSGGSSGSGGDGQKSGAVEDVQFWGSWSGAQAKQLEAQATAFNDSQDKYHVTYVAKEAVEESLLTGLASGRVPDVVLWDRYNTPLYVSKNALAPVDDYLAKDGVDVKQFYDQALSEMVVGGHTYGLPLLVDNRSLYYNQTLLDQAGAKPPKTWDELKAVAEKTAEHNGGKITKAGFALSDPGLFSMWLSQAGGSMYDGSGTKTAFNSAQGLDVLNFWKGLLDANVYKLGFGEGADAFAQGDVAMKYDGPWALADLEKAKVSYGIAQPATGPNGDKGAIMGGFGLVIPNGAKNADGAWAFMKWWATQPENGVNFAKISGWIPANREAANDPYFTQNPSYAAFIQTMEYAKVRSHVPGASDVESKALIPALEKFLAGEETAEQALTEAQQLGDKILADSN